MKRLCFLTVILFCLGTGKSNAQYTVLHSFNDTLGQYPENSLILNDGVLYGLAQNGGIFGCGCIFSIDTDGSGFQDLFNFDGVNGKYPAGALTYAEGIFYGMTSRGGVSGYGNIFSIHSNGSDFKDMLDFNGTNGNDPFGSLTYASGVLYGMSYFGGITHDSGCIFSLDTNGGGYKDLHDFNGTDGKNPVGDLTLSGKVLYGMTQGGGPHDAGTIFSIDTDGTNFNALLIFNLTDGESPYGDLTLSGNLLYGMTWDGGTSNAGNIFHIDTNGNGYTDMLDFTGATILKPYGDLKLSGAVLYGMTNRGGVAGNDSGAIFSIDTNGSGIQELYDFNFRNGYWPFGSVILSKGALYGMTSEGGKYNDGVIFKFKDTVVTTGIKKINPDIGVGTYPNPSTGMFTIASVGAKHFSPAAIEVFNILGEKVYSNYQPRTNFGASNYQIDLRSQPNGVYFYRVVGEEGSLAGEGKLIIQK